ncbi:hypothetical protein DKZ32_00040 [Limosilactobacillus reuteri]|nr:hypothetical protein DKZ33_00040 [Limosilactobacillus reuteri]PWT65108.1 hypothetical protein DKZ32_00040 [Limosilactobacillus reuteri]
MELTCNKFGLYGEMQTDEEYVTIRIDMGEKVIEFYEDCYSILYRCQNGGGYEKVDFDFYTEFETNLFDISRREIEEWVSEQVLGSLTW